MKWPGLLLVIALAFALPVPALGAEEANVKERGRPTAESSPAAVALQEQAPGDRTPQGEDKPQRSDVVARNHRWATLLTETLPGEGPRLR